MTDGLQPQSRIYLKIHGWDQNRLLSRIHTAYKHTRTFLQCLFLYYDGSFKHSNNEYCIHLREDNLVVRWSIPAETPQNEAEAAVGVKTHSDLTWRIKLTLQFNRATQSTCARVRHLQREVFENKDIKNEIIWIWNNTRKFLFIYNFKCKYTCVLTVGMKSWTFTPASIPVVDTLKSKYANESGSHGLYSSGQRLFGRSSNTQTHQSWFKV